jgi:hypothetical protein
MTGIAAAVPSMTLTASRRLVLIGLSDIVVNSFLKIVCGEIDTPGLDRKLRRIVLHWHKKGERHASGDPTDQSK